MTGRLRDHRIDHGQFIRNGGKVGEQIGDPQTTLTMLLKLPVVLTQESNFSEKNVGTFIGRKRLAMQLGELWFVVERIHLTHPTAETEMNHALRLGRIMRLKRRSGNPLFHHQRRQCSTSKPAFGPFEKFAS